MIPSEAEIIVKPVAILQLAILLLVENGKTKTETTKNIRQCEIGIIVKPVAIIPAP